MKRLLSLLTAAALALSLVPAEALATETGPCEHHTQHDANCGYSEAVPESPCTHVHTQDCYSSVTQCVHAHTEQCYSDGVLPADGEEKTADACAHVCSAEGGCITTALDCRHQHDETCGYAPATAGTPCAFVCEICSAAANEPAQCTCESKCAEGAVNGECPVCTAAPGSCTGKEPEPPAPVCNCTAKCAEDAANGECPVCGADPGSCTGKEPEPPAPVCNCTTKCAEGSVNSECPVCSAEGADLTACAGLESTEKETDEAVAAVQAAVDALPTAEALTAMTQEEQQAVYNALQAAYDAYQALNDEQKVQISGAEKFDALFEVFNAMVAPLTAAQLTRLIVGGTTVVESSTVGSTTSGTGWTYDVDSNTLTLKDATITGVGTAYFGAGIYAEGDLTIVLKGSSTVTGVVCNDESRGINTLDGNLTIQGGGSLTARGADMSGDSSYGIDVQGSFTQQGGSVTAIAGNVSGSNPSSGLNVSGTVTVKGGTLTATGGSADINSSYGISVYSSSVTVSDATVTATSGSAGYASYGLYIESSSPSVTLSGSSSLTARSGSATDTAGGICFKSYNSTGYVTVGDNSTLLANSVILHDNSFTEKPLAPTGDGSWLIYGQSDQTSAVGGNYTLTDDLTIESGNTLTIPAGSTLTLPQGKTLTVNGTLNIANQSSLAGSGSLAGGGAFNLTNPDPVISGSETLTYDGTDHFKEFQLEPPTDTVMGKNFTISGSASTEGWNLVEQEIINAGTYTLTASNGTSTIEKEVTVTPAEISISSATVQDKTYDGNTTATVESVTFSGTPQPAETDYTATAKFTDKNAADNKTATVTVNLKENGNYTFANGEKTATSNATATIEQLPVTLDWGTTSFTYDGTPKSVAATITNKVDSDSVELTYTGTITAADAGNYTATVSGLTGNDANNYTTEGGANLSQSWSIGNVSIAGAEVLLSQSSFTYNGQPQIPTVIVTLNGKTLTEGTDYTVTNNTGKDAGTYTLTVRGIGNYTGTTSKTYTIAKAPLTITGVDVQSKTYDGTTAATVTGVSFKGLVNGEALAMGVDYTATADFADASAGTGKSITGKVTLLSSALGKNYTLNGGSFTTSGDISAAASKLSFKVDRTKPVKGQYITFSVTPQIKGDNRSFLQRILGINAPKVEFWANGTTKLGEVKVEEGKTSTFAYDTDKGGLKLGKNTITAEFTGDGNLKGCTESVVVYLHDSTTSAPTGDESNIQTWTAVLAVSAVALVGLGVGAVIYRKKKK